MSLLKISNDRNSWIEGCNTLRGRIDQLLLAAPANTDFKGVKIETRVPTQRQANFLMNAIRRIVTPVDVFQVTEILARDPAWVQPEQTDVMVDLKGLQASTFFGLFDFLHEKFPDESFDQPAEVAWQVKSPKKKKAPDPSG
jgi:hypothetical protein